jgi:hypothetical protein
MSMLEIISTCARYTRRTFYTRDGFDHGAMGAEQREGH